MTGNVRVVSESLMVSLLLPDFSTMKSIDSDVIWYNKQTNKKEKKRKEGKKYYNRVTQKMTILPKDRVLVEDFFLMQAL